MCIVLIQGPHPAGSRHVAFSQLHANAQAAGKTLSVRTGDTLKELIECLHRSKSHDTEMVLLDSGEVGSSGFTAEEAELSKALDGLSSPYIEMHDASAQVLDQYVHPRNGPMATVVINHDRETSYRLALEIALRRLRKTRHAGVGMQA